jgi:hypothetical protein
VHYITENLHSALLAIRNSGERRGTKLLWVDALCINQPDLEERDSQVKMMRDIYKRASATVVWLGGTTEESEKAFSTITLLYEACQVPDFQKLLQRDELDLSVLDHLCLGGANLRISWESQNALDKFFSHPWFKRIWICQEVAVSKETFVIYGRRVRPWSYCVAAAYCMQRLHWMHSGTRGKVHFLKALEIDHYRTSIQDGSGLGLLELLTNSRQFQSTEPLDRVFGLYGLMGDAKEREIVDAFFHYRFSPLILFLNITVNLIIYQGTLDVLNLANNDPGSSNQWPSFVPNLASDNTGRQMGSRKGRDTWEYHAARDTLPRLKINGTAPQQGLIIRVDAASQLSFRGFIVDEMSRLGTEMVDMGFNTGVFLKDWFVTALLDDERNFYTVEEMEQAREYKKGLVARNQSTQLIESQDDSPEGSFVALTWGDQTEQNKETPPENMNPDLLAAIDSEPKRVSFSPSFTYPLPGILPGSAFWRTLIRNQDGDGAIPDASIASSHFQPWLRACFGGTGSFLSAWCKNHDAVGPRPVPTFNDWVDKASIGSRIFRTKQNYIGTGPRHAQPGDLVCVLYGGQTPFVLRRDAEGKFRFIGDCYVHGIMEGEALDLGLEEMEFVLV